MSKIVNMTTDRTHLPLDVLAQCICCRESLAHLLLYIVPSLPRELIIVHVPQTLINIHARAQSIQVNIPASETNIPASQTITGKHRYDEKILHTFPHTLANKKLGGGGAKSRNIIRTDTFMQWSSISIIILEGLWGGRGYRFSRSATEPI